MTTKKEVIFYHANCNDGACAGALMKFAKPNSIPYSITYKSDSEQIKSISENQTLTDNLPGSKLYILDFCLSDEVLKFIVDKYNVESIVILDHHETAPSILKNFAIDYKDKVDFKFIFDKQESGASLTYKYLIDNDFGITVPPSYFYFIVSMIKDRDLWQFKLDETAAFAEYLFSLNSAYDELLDLFQNGSNADVEECIKTGEILLYAKNKYIKQKMSNLRPVKHCEEINGEDVNFIVVNETREDAVSQLGNAIVDKYNCIALIYNIIEDEEKGTVVNVSLRGAEHLPSCSKIAQAYGGGGHHSAAGYKINTFELSKLFN